MKKFTTILLLFSLSVIFAGQKIKISTGEYSPWTSENLKHDGYVNHIVIESFKKVGIEVEFVYLPWKRAFEDCKRGKYAASSYWGPTEKRKKDFLFSEAVTEEKYVFFYLKTNDKVKEWTKLEDLKQYRIGATLGYTYTQEFRDAQNNKTLKIEDAVKDIQNFKKLLRGRIDIFPIGETVGFKMLNDEFASGTVYKFDILRKPLIVMPGYLLFPKKNPESAELVKKFNEGYKMLVKEGTIAKMKEDLIKGGYDK